MQQRVIPFLLSTVLFLTACSTVSRRPGSPGGPTEAEVLLETLVNRNPGLDGFKGIGKAIIMADGKNQIARVAWMGASPNRLRIEILGPAGQSVAGFAYDGQWMTIVSHAPVKFVKKRSSGANLKRLLSVPVNAGDMVALMAGRVPVRKHRTVLFSGAGDGVRPNEDTVLELKRAWGHVAERIFLDKAGGNVRQVEIYQPDGLLAYRVVFKKMQQINGYGVPSELQFSNDAGMALNLHIHRYWTKVDFVPSTFVLTPPKTANPAE